MIGLGRGVVFSSTIQCNAFWVYAGGGGGYIRAVKGLYYAGT